MTLSVAGISLSREWVRESSWPAAKPLTRLPELSWKGFCESTLLLLSETAEKAPRGSVLSKDCWCSPASIKAGGTVAGSSKE